MDKPKTVSHKGKKISEEAIQKQKETWKKKANDGWKRPPFTDEHKEKIKMAILGSKRTIEFKQKRSDMITQLWKDPVYREKTLESRRQAKLKKQQENDRNCE